MALPPIEVKGPAVPDLGHDLGAGGHHARPVRHRAEPTVGHRTRPSAGTEPAAAAGTFPQASRAIAAARNVDWAVWIYAAPAALLLLLTLIALGRLVALRARATVLVEANWLTALARAQRRMGFKHGTALLTSDELPSPISWGLMRPVILLNSEAARSHQEAEAIIAHELAHVAGLDWAKLMLSRITVALFWFNPLVWVLAREAHQLREEAADDAVLGADIEDTDYAKLLVGVARHECRGLLIGAHGVAPGRNSLSRRVRRVLDSSLARGPIGGAFALGVFVGAAMLAAPLAALTLTSKPAPAARHRRHCAQATSPRHLTIRALPRRSWHRASAAVAQAPGFGCRAELERSARAQAGIGGSQSRAGPGPAGWRQRRGDQRRRRQRRRGEPEGQHGRPDDRARDVWRHAPLCGAKCAPPPLASRGSGPATSSRSKSTASARPMFATSRPAACADLAPNS